MHTLRTYDIRLLPLAACGMDIARSEILAYQVSRNIYGTQHITGLCPSISLHSRAKISAEAHD